LRKRKTLVFRFEISKNRKIKTKAKKQKRKKEIKKHGFEISDILVH
jgi:hypothetical protein